MISHLPWPHVPRFLFGNAVGCMGFILLSGAFSEILRKKLLLCEHKILTRRLVSARCLPHIRKQAAGGASLKCSGKED